MEDTEVRRVMACPYNGKKCCNGIREDFPSDEVGQKISCRMWVGVAGKVPQSEKVVYHHDCAFAWQVTTHIEMSQTNRYVAASSDKFSNEVNNAVGAYNSLSKSLRGAGEEFRLLNENIKRLPELGADLPVIETNGKGEGGE